MDDARYDCDTDMSAERLFEGDAPLVSHLRSLRASWKTWALTAIAGMALGWVVTVATPRYRASASVELPGWNERLDSPGAVRADLDAQMRILRSDGLRRAAVGRLVDDPGVRPDPGWAAAVSDAATRVEIKPADHSRVIDISCQTASPEAAAGMVNALAEQFVETESVNRLKQAAQTRQWMEGQLAALAVRARKSEALLQEYARATDATQPDLDGLKRELLAARIERVRLQARVEALPPASGPAPTSKESPAHGHREAVLMAQVLHLREGLEQERAGILGRLQADFSVAERREKLLERELNLRQSEAGIPVEKLPDYRRIYREAEANREFYAAFLESVRQAGLAAGATPDAARILDRAPVPNEPLGPQPVVGAVTGLLTGLFTGCLFVIARAKLDRTIKRPGDARRALGLRELGAMPDAAFEHELVHMTPAGFAAQAPTPAEKACIEDRPSWLAECVRGIRASLLHGAQSPRVIAITSPTPSEGKTTVAANLAASLAESGRRTLVVDADLRRPRLHEVFGVSNSQGLADLLGEGYVDPLDFVVPVSKGLWFLPAGVAAFGGPGLLHEAATQELLERLRREFDAIVLDAPPALAVSDARVLSRIADGTVLVVRAGVTKPDDAIAAKTMLEADGAHLLGVVLNSWNPRIYGPQRYEKYGASYQGSAAA